MRTSHQQPRKRGPKEGRSIDRAHGHFEPISCSLAPWQLDTLDRLAQAQKISRNQAIRKALEIGLGSVFGHDLT